MVPPWNLCLKIKIIQKYNSIIQIQVFLPCWGEILYVGSPNLACYEVPNKHDARLILYSPVEVTEEERNSLNASFESVEVISVITIK